MKNYPGLAEMIQSQLVFFVWYTVRKIIRVKQKHVSRYTFWDLQSYFNTGTWYLHRLFGTFKARMVWISNDKSWCCNTTIWYFSTECIPEVGTQLSNIGIRCCCRDLNQYEKFELLTRMIPNVCTLHGVYGINSTAEDDSVEDISLQDISVEDISVEDISMKDISVEDTPVEDNQWRMFYEETLKSLLRILFH